MGLRVGAFGQATPNIIRRNLLVMVLLVLSFQILTGNSGIISYGHVGFMAIGAYTSALLTTPPAIKQSFIRDLPAFLANGKFDFVLAPLIGAGVVFVIALITGVPLARLSGSAGALATFAFLVMVNVVLSGWEGVTGGRRALYGVPLSATPAWTAGLAAVGLVLARLFRDSPLGQTLRATREDELAARMVGVNVERVRLVASLLSGVYAGVAGVLFAHFLGEFSPQQFYLTLTINALTMLIVGHMTTTSGSLIGAVIITLIFEALRGVETVASSLPRLPDLFGLAQIAIGLVLLFLMYFRLQGDLGRWELDEHVSRPRS